MADGATARAKPHADGAIRTDMRTARDSEARPRRCGREPYARNEGPTDEQARQEHRYEQEPDGVRGGPPADGPG